MLTKLQIALGVLAGVAIVVFFVAIITNARVNSSEPVPNWQPLVVLASFGIVICCSLGVIVAQVLELRPPKEKKEKESVEIEVEAPAEEMAAVGAPMEQTKEEAGQVGDLGATEAIAEEPAPLGDFPIEASTTEDFKSEFEDLSSDFMDFDEEK